MYPRKLGNQKLRNYERYQRGNLKKSNPRNDLLSGAYSGGPREGEFCQEIEVLKEGEEKQREENKKKLSRIRTRDRGFERRRREIERRE